eukprot:scaffold22591_cov125-Cylindrotheca_fusiformis.AAC.1
MTGHERMKKLDYEMVDYKGHAFLNGTNGKLRRRITAESGPLYEAVAHQQFYQNNARKDEPLVVNSSAIFHLRLW